MIRTVRLTITIALLTGVAAAQAARQVKAGEAVPLSAGVTLKVTAATKSPFSNVKLKGVPFVVVLELDAGTREAALSYRLSPDPKSSDLYLSSGTQKLAPRAVVEDFPSWGSDNDKEVELVEPHDAGVASLNFRRSGTISVLFDLPPDQAATPKKLSLVVRTLTPSEKEHSLTVSL